MSDSNHDSRGPLPESRDSEPPQGAADAILPDPRVKHGVSETGYVDAARGDSVVRRLEEQVLAAEAELAQKKRARDKPAPKLEPLYMLLFLGFTVFALGGMHGHMELVGRSLRHLGPQDVGILGAIERNAMAILNSYMPHFETWWALDIGIIVIAAAFLVKIKQVPLRRRAFRLICSLTVAIFAALMIATILDHEHPLRKSFGAGVGEAPLAVRAL